MTQKLENIHPFLLRIGRKRLNKPESLRTPKNENLPQTLSPPIGDVRKNTTAPVLVALASLLRKPRRNARCQGGRPAARMGPRSARLPAEIARKSDV